jgi:hypothetical protein
MAGPLAESGNLDRRATRLRLIDQEVGKNEGRGHLKMVHRRSWFRTGLFILDQSRCRVKRIQWLVGQWLVASG